MVSALVNAVIADGSKWMVIFYVSTDINYYVMAKLYTTNLIFVFPCIIIYGFTGTSLMQIV